MIFLMNTENRIYEVLFNSFISFKNTTFYARIWASFSRLFQLIAVFRLRCHHTVSLKYYFAAILDHLCKILAMFRASSIPQCSRPSNFIPRLLNTSSRVPFRSLLKVSVQFSQINPLCGILGYGNGAEIALN